MFRMLIISEILNVTHSSFILEVGQAGNYIEEIFSGNLDITMQMAGKSLFGKCPNLG